MTDVFFASDTHFSHTNVWAKFKKDDGVTPLRPFTSNEEMDEIMIQNWNSVVKENSIVYHLGDVAMNKKHVPKVAAMNGRKRLILGNHDNNLPTKDYLYYFEQVYGVKVLDGLILSHVPLHRGSVVPRMGTNIHGHLHGSDIPDGAYYCVSMENIDYTPISLEDLRVKIAEKREKYSELDYEGRSSGNGPG